MKKIFDVSFEGIEEIKRLAKERVDLLSKNVETAVADTVLLGVTRIANDCPVDTGRARASIAGNLADQVPIPINGDPEEIAKGKAESLTGIFGKKGQIGSNVEYLIYLEYFKMRAYQRKLSGKQIRYLFATGILESDGQGGVIYKYRRKKSPRGFFRKNIPIIRSHFKRVMENAISTTTEGRLLRKGE